MMATKPLVELIIETELVGLNLNFIISMLWTVAYSHTNNETDLLSSANEAIRPHAHICHLSGSLLTVYHLAASGHSKMRASSH
jgi:hypothetical protein